MIAQGRPGFATWRCGDGHEWESPAVEFAPETPTDVESIAAVGSGDTCPECGRGDADPINFVSVFA